MMRMSGAINSSSIVRSAPERRHAFFLGICMTPPFYSTAPGCEICDISTDARGLARPRSTRKNHSINSDVATASGNWEVGAFWTEGGDGSKTAVWHGDNPLVGTYRISVYYGHPAIGRLASNAPFTIVSEGGSQSVRVDYNRNAGEWRLLGIATNPYYVRLTNQADGAVIADAVKFERMD